MGFNALSEPKYTVQQSVNLNVVGAAEVAGAAPTDVLPAQVCFNIVACVK